MKNLDLMAAETANAVCAGIDVKGAKEAEDLIAKTLGVLQENGPYAAVLYLCARSEKDGIARAVRKKLLVLASELGVPNLAGEEAPERILGSVVEYIARDTSTLLLVKWVWEQALIYARFGAKSVRARARSAGG